MTTSGPSPPGGEARAKLGVYVHWPYCARICPYCDFNVFRARGREAEAAELARAIVSDLEAQRAITGPRELVSVFFGGGTPSLMDPAWVADIVGAATRLWTPAPDLEVSLEANPTDVEAGRFAGLVDAGVNRLSLGLQSLDDAALRFLGRNHDAAEGRRAAETAARLFPRLSLDLIYALPDQTPQAWAEALRTAVALGAEHVSPYQLTIEEGTAFDRAVRRGLFVPPGDEAGADLYDATQAVLEAEGFEAYEVSNHARGEAARSRHNLVYWTGVDYVGVGPGAHGRITVDGARVATEAADRPADYIARVATAGTGFAARETLTAVQAAEERLLSGLRIRNGVGFGDVSALGLSPEAPVVRRLIEMGLLADDTQRLRATKDGRRLLNAVTSELVLGA
ncbi:MAG: coproporphyrinogen III oxidase [Phenylobacterium sp.]|uniref:radical SAM family heme chaperone HemW n=1 Tax=Phenylobacterium sp. TaxID=1871053 RepID=UPI0011F86AA4|nr:radical SAM family heme chaperone HemW [Phenylobacterium sp.]TAL28665.1 MAG: coproporphyrinogen III oxidase [Phenylobacterium sp.]